MEHSPITPLGAYTPHAHPAFAPVIASLATAVAIGIYLVAAYLQGWWPLAGIPEPAASASVSPSPSGVAVSYHNATFGFMVNLPESWRGFTFESDVMTVNRIDGSGQTETFRQFNIIHPKSTSQVPRQDIPVMVFTTLQWERIVREELSVGAAPIPPSELARNSKYVFALPARYNYALYDGWEEVEAIMKTNPVSAYEPSADLSEPEIEWRPFSSRNFTLSFQVPTGFDVFDGQDTIEIAKGHVEHIYMGASVNNAFVKLTRYIVENTNDLTKPAQIDRFQKSHRNITTSTMTVDGSSFMRMDGTRTDNGDPAFAVFFDKSAVYVARDPSDPDRSFDPIEVAEQILATFRFSK